MVLRLFEDLLAMMTVTREMHFVISMIEEGIFKSNQLQDELPIGVSYPLMEAVRGCPLNLPRSDSAYLPSAAYNLVERNDLAALSSNGRPAEKTGTSSRRILIHDIPRRQ